MSVGITPQAHASDYGIELNGKYLVTSNGEWAKTNDVFHNEKTVQQVWTMSSSCVSPASCTGELISSDGWTAPMRYSEDRWIVDRYLPNWQPCYDGTTSPGKQKYLFWPVDATGQRTPTDGALFGGTDTTIGVSGGCGRNLPLTIRLPVRLQRIPQ
jgi:hypothetical protein